VDYEYALGDFESSAEIGSYAADERGTGTGTYFVDDTTPAAGTGLWYLFRPNCPQGGCSWQSALGAEPGRDAALP
jgi:hypothetical protein